MSTPAIDDAEILYRQIHPGGAPIYFDAARTPAISQAVFLPTSADGDGLSLLRACFRSAIWSAYRPEQPSVRFRLGQLGVLKLRQLALDLGFADLHFTATPDSLDNLHGEPWAHCVTIQINRRAYDSDREAKRRIKEWAMGVAKAVSLEAVIGPFEAPAQDSPYRPED
jgi:hypothetical protein